MRLVRIVLVHGAGGTPATWDAVAPLLRERGHPVTAATLPMESLEGDVAHTMAAVDGPVLLVGHSYGGAVISNVAADAGDIAGLVYVAGFAPEPGESALTLSQRYPGSTLGDALQPVRRSDGTTDLYIARERFHDQFAADLPEWEAARMAVTQRPVALGALEEPAGERPLWKELPSWFLIGELDRNIPAALQRFMAHRAGARRTIQLPGASHAVAVSHPDATSRLILEAAALRVAA
jgi:pimeloyl-ACP methyl ester carboxylesterase